MNKKPLQILYADDDQDDREMFNELVKYVNQPVEPLIFENGLPLIQHLETLRDDQLPDCIMLDMNMPIWDGLKTLQAIRRIRRYSNISVVMFTTSSQFMERTYCMQLGANAFFTKPVSFKEYKTLAGELLHLLS